MAPIKICLNQSYDGIAESLRVAITPKIIQALGDTSGRSFIVDFDRSTDRTENIFSDFAYITFRAYAPIAFAESEKPEQKAGEFSYSIDQCKHIKELLACNGGRISAVLAIVLAEGHFKELSLTNFSALVHLCERVRDRPDFIGDLEEMPIQKEPV